MTHASDQQTRILVIEDDASINEVVAAFLAKKGFSCTQAYSGSEARLLLEDATDSYDLVITDLMLPGLSGQELVKLIRQNRQVPIIVTSALEAPEQKVDLFELGADDYLTKPFDLHELHARVTVQLRHAQRAETGDEIVDTVPADIESVAQHGAAEATGSSSSNEPDILVFRDWTLKPESRQFLAAGEPVKFTRLEYNIVEVLMRRPTKVFTKQELFELAWSEECFIEEKAINVHMSNIRSKLKKSNTHEYIETVWGIGFKLAQE